MITSAFANGITRRAALKAGMGSLIGLAPATASLSRAFAEQLSCFSSLLSSTYLSGLAWVDNDKFPGFRLRWVLPIFKPAGDIAHCLPELVTVHRGNTPQKLTDYYKPSPIAKGRTPTLNYPRIAWDSNTLAQRGSNPATFVPVNKQGNQLPTVAGVSFTYRGSVAQVQIENSRGGILASFSLSDGDVFYFEAPEIAQIRLLHGVPGELSECRCLNVVGLISELGLNYGEPVVDIAVREVFYKQAPLADVKLRLWGDAGPDEPVTTMPELEAALTEDDWQHLVDFADEIAGSTCEGAPKVHDGPDGLKYRPLDYFAAGLAARWEYSVFAGFGFRDGPHRTKCKYDSWRGVELNTPPNEDFYYVIEGNFKDNVPFVSNPVFFSTDHAVPLRPPGDAHYETDGVPSRGVVSIGSATKLELNSLPKADAERLLISTTLR